jgi:hypothetical protein
MEFLTLNHTIHPLLCEFDLDFGSFSGPPWFFESLQYSIFFFFFFNYELNLSHAWYKNIFTSNFVYDSMSTWAFGGPHVLLIPQLHQEFIMVYATLFGGIVYLTVQLRTKESP